MFLLLLILWVIFTLNGDVSLLLNVWYISQAWNLLCGLMLLCCLCTTPSDSKCLSSQIFSTLIEGGGSGRVELTGLGAHMLTCTKLWALHPTLEMLAQTWDPRLR